MSRIVLQSERAGIDGSGDFAAAVGQMCSFPLGIPLPPQKAMTHLAQIKGMVSAVLQCRQDSPGIAGRKSC
jgi:hypothetical protein